MVDVAKGQMPIDSGFKVPSLPPRGALLPITFHLKLSSAQLGGCLLPFKI